MIQHLGPPLLLAVVALGLLATNAFEPVAPAAYLLSVVVLGGVVVRMAVAFYGKLELAARSRREALTDPLTGLANRRCLEVDLAEAAQAATRDAPQRLVLFDLNGFKHYNDRFGHPAGDALLATLAHRLEAAVGPYGRSYRLGGDEFCALYGPAAPATDVVVASARAALSEAGDGFEITTAHGAVAMPHDARDPWAALQVADDRLYADKRPQATPEWAELDLPAIAVGAGRGLSR